MDEFFSSVTLKLGSYGHSISKLSVFVHQRVVTPLGAIVIAMTRFKIFDRDFEFLTS